MMNKSESFLNNEHWACRGHRAMFMRDLLIECSFRFADCRFSIGPGVRTKEIYIAKGCLDKLPSVA